jgi:hypothetical protein
MAAARDEYQGYDLAWPDVLHTGAYFDDASAGLMP